MYLMKVAAKLQDKHELLCMLYVETILALLRYAKDNKTRFQRFPMVAVATFIHISHKNNPFSKQISIFITEYLFRI